MFIYGSQDAESYIEVNQRIKKILDAVGINLKSDTTECIDGFRNLFFLAIVNRFGNLTYGQTDTLPEDFSAVMALLNQNEHKLILDLVTTLALLSTMYTKQGVMSMINTMMTAYKDMDSVATGVLSGMTEYAINVSDLSDDDNKIRSMLLGMLNKSSSDDESQDGDSIERTRH